MIEMLRTHRLSATLLASALLLCTATSQAASTHCPVTLDQSDQDSLAALLQQANAGDACAQFNIGYHRYTQQNYPASERWYAKAAEQGVSRAAFEIAMLYRDNLLPGDDAERKRWLTQAAEQGLVLAQVELGIDYLDNPGDQDDRYQAMHWFEQAALQGDIQSQYLLAELYWSRDSGVQFAASGDERAIHFSSSDSKALYWICKAAQNSHAPAQFSLSQAYGTGSGMPLNRDQQQLWLELAARNGSEEAKAQLDDSGLAWYTRLEKWGKRQMLDATAQCPDSALETDE
jgi:TPR repeat protein